MVIIRLGLGDLEQIKNFQETIKDLKRKLDESISNLKDANLTQQLQLFLNTYPK